LEKAGIPTVGLIFPDQGNYYKNVALTTGCPNIRWIGVPRIGTPVEMVATYYQQVKKCLCDPLTAKEKESGLYSPPNPPRVLFEGTDKEAQDFLQQTTLIENCRMCPIAKYTDGLPVIIPTEESVAAMLTGTSHKPTETVGRPFASLGMGGVTTPAGAQVTYAQSFTSTVEKVAICAVMAGCKPQYMPVALAEAVAGGGSTNCPGTSSMWPVWWVVSGPIAKELGMNAGQGSMDVGNPANVTLGRVGALMTINFGGCITGLVRTDSGNPIHSVMFAEDLDASVFSQGWIGFNEECTHFDAATGTNVPYKKTESVLGKGGGWGLVTGIYTFPGYYRSLNQGQYGLARTLGVEGKPGKYNWLEVFAPLIVADWPAPSAQGFIMHMNLAQLLYDYGFKTKDAVYKWLWDTYTIPVTTYKKSGLFDHPTDAGTTKEPTSGRTWNDLLQNDPNYQLHVFGGANYKSNCIIVGDSFGDEHWYYNVFGGKPSAQPIDPWR